MLNPGALAEPKGYNNGVLVEGGSLLFVAGQIGWDLERRIVSDDFAGQFEQALTNVLASFAKLAENRRASPGC